MLLPHHLQHISSIDLFVFYRIEAILHKYVLYMYTLFSVVLLFTQCSWYSLRALFLCIHIDCIGPEVANSINDGDSISAILLDNLRYMYYNAYKENSDKV